MDYTTQPILFRLKKVLRYLRLYGLRRTLIKVRGQLHMKRRFEEWPPVGAPNPRQHVGLIGCGNFGYSNIAYYLRKNYGGVLRGCMDIDLDHAASLFQDFRVGYYSNNADEIVEDSEIDLVFVASNHASHAEYAIECLKRGKHVHIEKPHVVTYDQLVRLCLAMEQSNARVNLGFNRPFSKIGRDIKEALDSQNGPSMLNWFVAGHEIPEGHWYFEPSEGGRILGNLCHWTDFIYHLVEPENRFPLRIVPVSHVKSDSDIVATYVFGDGSMATISFSAKGHTFEGVRERFAAHRGNVLISMDDFHSLTIEELANKRTYKPLNRDHGHERAVTKSYSMREAGGFAGVPVAYVWESADLFLSTKRALETREVQTLTPFTPERLATSRVD